MRIFLVFVISVVLFSCGQGDAEKGVMKAKAVDKPSDDFMAFYHQFLSDSVFQMQHIAWPLQGVTDTDPDANGNVKKVLTEWDSTNWVIHHLVNFDDNAEFTRQFEVMGDEVVIEYIRTRAMNYGMERRFTRNDAGEWELIYYADMQEMK